MDREVVLVNHLPRQNLLASLVGDYEFVLSKEKPIIGKEIKVSSSAMVRPEKGLRMPIQTVKPKVGTSSENCALANLNFTPLNSLLFR